MCIMKILRSICLGMTLVSGFVVSGPLHAADNNGIIALPYEQSNTLVIVDTNAKKILVYSVNTAQGLSLKEVRSFEKALQAPKDFFTSKGLTTTTEKKELEALKSEN